jgi:uncharacterized OsmC-like protein
MPLRRAYVPVEGVDVGPFRMGMHGEVAECRNVDLSALDPEAIQPTTYDYVITAAAGCMMGLLAIALEGRDIPTTDGRLVAEGIGELEPDTESNALLLRRIHVKYHLRLDPSKREAAERAHGLHTEHCSIVRSLSPAIECSSSLEMEDI